MRSRGAHARSGPTTTASSLRSPCRSRAPRRGSSHGVRVASRSLTALPPQSTSARAAFLAKPHLAFLTVACVFGIAFAVTVPSLAGFDEAVHFLRAWNVSNADVFAQTGVREGETEPTLGTNVPEGLQQQLLAILRDGILHPDNARRTWSHIDDPAPRGIPTFVDFSAAAVYPPVPYIPSAIGIRVGRALGASAFVLVLLARLAELAVFLALLTLAVRRLPSRQWILAVVALMPVVLFQAATVSADAITNALALLVIALALALTAQPVDAVPRRLLVETMLATIALALCKQPYLLAAALLVVPAARHRRQIGAWLAGTLALGGVLALAWTRWANDHYIAPDFLPASLGGRANYANNNVQPPEQLEYLRSHPFAFTGAVWRMLTEHGGKIAGELTAQVSYWHTSGLIAVLVAVGVIAAVLVDAGPLPGGPVMRALALGLALAGLVASLFLAYVGWNALRAPRIDGYQGRYLVVMLALAALTLSPGTDNRQLPALTSLRARVGARTGWLVAWSALMLLAVELGIFWHSYV